MIHYNTEKNIDLTQLLALYSDVGWTAYTQQPHLLKEAVAHSLFVLSAWDNEQLVGLIRCVGDGFSIIYIQDILVLKKYQNSGIGSAFMSQIIQKYATVRQKVLLTEEAPDVRHFYEKHGFISADCGTAVGFYRNDVL